MLTIRRYPVGPYQANAWIAFDDAVPALRRVRDAGLVVALLTNDRHSIQEGTDCNLSAADATMSGRRPVLPAHRLLGQ